MSQTPRLEEVIEATVEERLESFFTAVPALVTDYNSETQTATVEIMVAKGVEDGKGVKHWHHATIYNVLVLFPGSVFAGIDHYRITFPIGRRSRGVYLVSTLDLNRWKSSKGNEPIDINSAKGTTNHISQGWFIPADTLSAKPSTPSAPIDAMVLHGPKVKIGGPTGTEPTIMANTWQTEFDAVMTEIATQITAAGGAGATVTTKWTAFKTKAYKSTKTEVK